MTAIAPYRRDIQVEETKADGAVSEGTQQRIGGNQNFINNRHFYEREFNINGFYNGFAGIVNVGDGYCTYPFNFEIVHVLVYSGQAMGTGGTTEIDLKWKPELSGSFASIFSTTPKFDNTAPVETPCRNGGTTITGMTNPVLSKTKFAAFSTIKAQVLQAQTGDPKGVYVKLFIRPINDDEVV